ncbi:N-acetyltransferase [Streptomyces mashuensis]|uniref:N-acetyltransferase n=1 Tax=Streptomyces mashuensis TaxID=33904 RepID=A0A919AZD1_9ACTN|nr:GNAT family N-acetyltransferase [Streptomyces mashuensis]GHF34250.1 N-acetyltransferase [Streptomyces mashuensis]
MPDATRPAPAADPVPASTRAWTVEPRPLDSPGAVELLRAYLHDVADRWYRLHHARAVTDEEMARHWDEMCADDSGPGGLRPPQGVLLVARYGGRDAGCVGLRRLEGPEGPEGPGDAGTAELTRMFVLPEMRGLGGAPRLLSAAEDVARAWGVRRLLLNTRRDLVEARALYTRHGYTDVPPYRIDDPYAEVFLAKEL